MAKPPLTLSLTHGKLIVPIFYEPWDTDKQKSLFTQKVEDILCTKIIITIGKEEKRNQ